MGGEKLINLAWCGGEAPRRLPGYYRGGRRAALSASTRVGEAWPSWPGLSLLYSTPDQEQPWSLREQVRRGARAHPAHPSTRRVPISYYERRTTRSGRAARAANTPGLRPMADLSYSKKANLYNNTTHLPPTVGLPVLAYRRYGIVSVTPEGRPE